MKKSSLITLALASLVGLVGCNQQAAAPKKSKGSEAAYSFLKSFFWKNFYHDDEGYITNKNGMRVKDEDGNYIKIDPQEAEGNVEDFELISLSDEKETIGLNYESESVDMMKYYKIPESQDSFSLVYSYYDGLTDADLASYRDIVLHNTAFAAFDAFFEEDITDPEVETLTPVLYDMLYIPQEGGLSNMVGLFDSDYDGENDFGYLESINSYGEEGQPEDIVIYFEVVSSIVPVTSGNNTTYSSIAQVNVFAVPEDAQFSSAS